MKVSSISLFHFDESDIEFIKQIPKLRYLKVRDSQITYLEQTLENFPILKTLEI